jgi:2-polyprenyl-3-methyl-5-hydroxy-6-metoxy-1,4-benzoquinol methylase
MSKAAKNIGEISVGHYDQIFRSGFSVRRSWHQLKFQRVLESVPNHKPESIIDVGCFAGSFLSICTAERFPRQLGVDILADQIAYSKAHYERPFREFRYIRQLADLLSFKERFDNLTGIEVIEHLSRSDLRIFFQAASSLLRPGGRMVITTPNYHSLWPLLEVCLNQFSDINYAGQHVTKFTVFNIEKLLHEIFPRFKEIFKKETLTTTHLAAPFFAVFGTRFARQLSSFVAHRYWNVKFGSLILGSWLRR